MLSSIAKKNLMAASGLFLCFFLLIHCLGNLPLLLPEDSGRSALNQYAEFLSDLLVIKIASISTLLVIVLHASFAFVLSRRAQRAVGEGYQMQSPAFLATWTSRLMGASGVLLLVFIVLHLADFWYPYKFGGEEDDLYGIVQQALMSPLRVGFYVLSMVALGLHLAHGTVSACRSLGLHYPGLARLVRWLGIGFAVALATTFSTMTLSMFLRH